MELDLDKYLNFLQLNYQMKFKRYGGFLFIRTPLSEFKIDIEKGEKDGKYIIYHRLPLNDKKYHIQEITYNLYLGLYRACSHDFNVTHNIPFQLCDYLIFIDQFLKNG